MYTRMTELVAIAALAITLGPGSQGRAADMPMIDLAVDQGGLYAPVSPTNLGFAFSLSESIIATSLMIWDEGNDGLAVSHAVGLWNQNGPQLLASATIPSGTTAPATLSSSGAGSWRYVSITPLQLDAGSYVVAGLYGGGIDCTRTGVTNIITQTGVSYIQGRSVENGSLAYSTDVASGPLSNGYFGANVGITPVPEPSTYALGGIGTLTMAWLARRRRAKA